MRNEIKWKNNPNYLFKMYTFLTDGHQLARVVELLNEYFNTSQFTRSKCDAQFRFVKIDGIKTVLSAYYVKNVRQNVGAALYAGYISIKQANILYEYHRNVLNNNGYYTLKMHEFDATRPDATV